MNKTIATGWLTGVLCTWAGMASAASFSTTARVVRATPVYQTIEINEPQQKCHDETVVYEKSKRNDGTAGTVLGGIIGGVLGHQIGKGRGRTVATIAGAVAGGVIGNHASRSKPDRSRRTERVCRTVNRYREERQLNGYDVTYRYQGRTFRTMLGHNPGNRLRVRVTINPR